MNQNHIPLPLPHRDQNGQILSALFATLALLGLVAAIQEGGVAPVIVTGISSALAGACWPWGSSCS